jgi:hypothetical protein
MKAIALIEIPHQCRPQLHWYNDREALVDAAYELDWDRDVDDFDNAVHLLADDWSGYVLIETADDLEAARSYEGHQQHRVLPLVAQVADKIEFTD